MENFPNLKIDRTIVHVTSAHNYNDTRIFLREAKLLADLFKEVIVLAPDAPDACIDGVKFIGFNEGTLPRGRTKRIGVLRKIKEKISLLKPDLIHMHDPELLLLIPEYCHKNKIKCIYDIHEDYRNTIRNNSGLFVGALLSIIYDIIEKKAMKKISGTIHVTNQISEKYKHYNIPSAVVRNLPDTENIISLMTNSPYDKKNNKLVYSGSLEQRSLFHLADAVMELSKKYDDVKVCMIGEFRWEKTKKDLIEYWRKRNVLQRLEIFPRIERNIFLQKLNEFVVGLVLFWPSKNVQLALPNKMFEYMAAGLPIIVPDCPNHRELVVNHKCGVFCDTTNSNSIYQAIDSLLNNKEESLKMGIRGREACLKYYNAKVDFSKLLDLYGEVLKDGSKNIL